MPREKTEPDIIVVDDTPANLRLLVSMLKARGYKARPVTSGLLALQAARHLPPDLILLDINMPGMDGYEVCKRLKRDETLKEIPVIFISALSETVDKVKAFTTGGVDYVTKPFQFEEVEARVSAHLRLRSLQLELEKYSHHLEELVEEKIREISRSQMATILALAKLAESRDTDTGAHLERVQAYCAVLASKLAERPSLRSVITPAYTENLVCASSLHDIGKVGVPDSILLKSSSLTPEEYAVMKEHTLIGARTLEAVHDQYPDNAFITMGIEIARWHHERWDGKGYPDGLSGERIPLSARIMCLVDVYDALTSKRIYKGADSEQKTCEIIEGETGKQFDPAVQESFCAAEAEFAAIRSRING